jgi:hypothetical protein
VAEATPLMVTGSRKSHREGSRTRYSPQGPTPSDLLHPMRPHLLKLPEPPKIVPPVGDQAFLGTFHVPTTPAMFVQHVPRAGHFACADLLAANLESILW